MAARFYRNVPEEAGVGAALPVVLSDGDLVQGISSGLVAGGSITGRLVDPGGVGIADCELRAYTADGSLVTRSSRSGADGSFDVGGLSTGSYRLLVSARTCGLGRASLHLDTGPPPRLVGDPAARRPAARRRRLADGRSRGPRDHPAAQWRPGRPVAGPIGSTPVDPQVVEGSPGSPSRRFARG